MHARQRFDDANKVEGRQVCTEAAAVTACVLKFVNKRRRLGVLDPANPTRLFVM